MGPRRARIVAKIAAKSATIDSTMDPYATAESPFTELLTDVGSKAAVSGTTRTVPDMPTHD